MTQNEANNIKAMFDRIDENDSQSLDADELVEFAKLVGYNINREQAKTIIENVDSNEDGVIQFDEFLEIYREYMGLSHN